MICTFYIAFDVGSLYGGGLGWPIGWTRDSNDTLPHTGGGGAVVQMVRVLTKKEEIAVVVLLY